MGLATMHDLHTRDVVASCECCRRTKRLHSAITVTLMLRFEVVPWFTNREAELAFEMTCVCVRTRGGRIGASHAVERKLDLANIVRFPE